jgi:hypothetical protein
MKSLLRALLPLLGLTLTAIACGARSEVLEPGGGAGSGGYGGGAPADLLGLSSEARLRRAIHQALPAGK